jgi:hypothetical protein
VDLAFTVVSPLTSTTACRPSLFRRVPDVPAGMTFPLLSRTSLVNVTVFIALPLP